MSELWRPSCLSPPQSQGHKLESSCLVSFRWGFELTSLTEPSPSPQESLLSQPCSQTPARLPLNYYPVTCLAVLQPHRCLQPANEASELASASARTLEVLTGRKGNTEIIQNKKVLLLSYTFFPYLHPVSELYFLYQGHSLPLGYPLPLSCIPRLWQPRQAGLCT